MAKRENETFKIKDLMPQMLKENKLQGGINQIDVKEIWGEVMGNGVLTYTDSVLLKNKTLYVKLTSSALREELSYGKDKIVVMLNDALENISITTIKLV
ncbi:MAG: DUF721 domain-containing protein [Flavobacteriaceae bacterium]|nr:DUF721 domain-containing protein [Flavobacteriaceae bacterium]